MDYDVSLQTISWFNERKNDDTLEISPKFQRRAVWMEKERSALMDTICNLLPFPELYIQVVTESETGKQKYIVVDGQQRVTSILMFIENEFCLPHNDTWNGQYFRDLTTDQKDSFWSYKVVVRSLRKTNDEEIRSIFTKLNTNNVSLNDQELRNARFSGRFKELAERLADNPLFQAIGLFTPRDVRRMLDIEYVSELLLRQIYGVTNKKDMLDLAYYNFDDEFPLETECEMSFNASINLIWSIINNQNKLFFKTKGSFYSLFGVCLDYYKETGRTQFSQPESIQSKLITFSEDIRDHNYENGSIEDRYAEVSSRSTSDKSRRVEREAIIGSIIRSCESLLPRTV